MACSLGVLVGSGSSPRSRATQDARVFSSSRSLEIDHLFRKLPLLGLVNPPKNGDGDSGRLRKKETHLLFYLFVDCDLCKEFHKN